MEKQVVARIPVWSQGEDTLIQCVVFNPWGEEIETIMVSASEADQDLMEAVENFVSGQGSEYAGGVKELLYIDEGSEVACYGYVDNAGYQVEFWDCDEQTWSEYLEEEG
ncbi:MAG: hypothetical protein IJ111_01335 [Eggerthellaceae bacterium]|nr:hypothetical protein [Eggerthellaceae bacterium]